MNRNLLQSSYSNSVQRALPFKARKRSLNRCPLLLEGSVSRKGKLFGIRRHRLLVAGRNVYHRHGPVLPPNQATKLLRRISLVRHDVFGVDVPLTASLASRSILEALLTSLAFPGATFAAMGNSYSESTSKCNFQPRVNSIFPSVFLFTLHWASLSECTGLPPLTHPLSVVLSIATRSPKPGSLA